MSLAEELADVKKYDTCFICFDKDAKDALKCKNCGTIAHRTCWAQWTPKTSIGIPYVFRCYNCYNLINNIVYTRFVCYHKRNLKLFINKILVILNNKGGR